MILHGDCREQLATLPDASVDAIVTDPPYELGFMGKRWDASGIAYDPDVWGQCLRVLKPGAHLLAFGGTRTYHRMVVAIEDAGFEIRDSLHWLYGSGFPKSLDVSKAIDKAAGAEREVVGVVPWDNSANHFVPGEDHTRRVQRNVTAPATPAAAAAAGWGTALKPAHEPIVLARKPLAGTVATNFTEYGTGALNIDATRVGMSDADRATIEQATWIGRNRPDVKVYGDYATDGTDQPMRAHPAGRWPANIILTHSPECEQIGAGTSVILDKKRGRRPGHTIGQTGGDRGDPMPNGPTYVDEPPTWNCVPGCPVATLNEQSGTTSSGRPSTQVTYGSHDDTSGNAIYGRGLSSATPNQPPRGDSGGASRFFTTTEWDPELDVPFLYVAKPSRKERNAGLDGMPLGRTDFGGNGRPGAGFNEVTHGKAPSPAANFHPTVKPVALIRHLIRLITPPGGTVLDPFLGSGTTAVAAILEGFNWIGCELTDDYLPIIEARTTWAEQNRPEPDLTLFTEQP